MTSLEHRYRRLISLYPAAHRRRYQMEMLSTLMDGAGENQRTPRFRESIDLLWNAIWLRLNRDGGPPERDPRWAQAAAVFGVLGAMTVAGLYVMQPLGELVWRSRLTEVVYFWPGDLTWIPFAQGGAWLAVAVTALLGRRRVAAIIGWAAVLATVAWADAMLADIRMDGPAPWASAVIDRWGTAIPSMPGMDDTGVVPPVLLALFLAVAVWIQYKVDAGVRRRLRAYAWVPLATFVLLRLTYTSEIRGSIHWWLERVPVTVGDWLALVLVPLAVFGIAVIVVRRKDSQQRLIELGRAQL